MGLFDSWGTKSKKSGDYGKKSPSLWARGTKFIADHSDTVAGVADKIGSVAGVVGTVAGIAAPLAAATGIGAPLAAGLLGVSAAAKTLQGGAALVRTGAKTAGAGARAGAAAGRAIDDLRGGHMLAAARDGRRAIKSGKEARAGAKRIQRALR